MNEKLFTNQKQIEHAIQAAKDQADKCKDSIYTHCVFCGCAPKPDGWSIVAENCCFDCA